MPSVMTLAAYAGGLLLTLCLAAWLTPRSWWRRANARACAVLAGGTLALGALLDAVSGTEAQAGAALRPQAQPQPPLADHGRASAPLAGTRYRVRDALNLRASTGIHGPRLAVVPAGAQVTATGRADGDWWQVRAVVNGRTWEGWASSLWLRRGDEKPSGLVDAG